jgi:hypothetical protein
MLTVISSAVEQEDEAVVTRMEVAGTAVLDGTSIWGYDYKRNGMEVACTDITVYDYGDYKDIHVAHNAGWQIYTDAGFEHSISAVLGYNVAFTEQGMQDDGFASMET